jgi:hypothetical protein
MTFGLLPGDIAAGTTAKLEPRVVPRRRPFPTVNRDTGWPVSSFWWGLSF